jgi:hypothetical protein
METANEMPPGLEKANSTYENLWRRGGEQSIGEVISEKPN